MDGQIRLRWTSHQGTVLSLFDVLLASESFVDVTLACEGQYIRAHRVILSACSPYFQKLLDLDTSKHPIFFLKDVKYAELKALIQYMYRGEVSIAHEDLNSLLAVAQSLKIRGLTEVETTTNSISSDTIILKDIGSKRQKTTPHVPPSTAAPSPPPAAPAPITIPSTSTVQLTRISSTRPFASATATSTTSHTASSSMPAIKKPRIDPKIPTTQITQVQRVSQVVDPLQDGLNVLPQDPLETVGSISTPPFYESSSRENDNFASLAALMEEPEAYGGQEVKIEADIPVVDVEVDLDEEEQEGDNSMSQSSFSERFQLGDDNPGRSEQEPGDGYANNDDGTERTGGQAGGSDGEGRRKFQYNKYMGSIYNGRFFEILSCEKVLENSGFRSRISAKCVQCNAVVNTSRSSNAVRHLQNRHPRSFLQYQRARTAARNKHKNTAMYS